MIIHPCKTVFWTYHMFILLVYASLFPDCVAYIVFFSVFILFPRYAVSMYYDIRLHVAWSYTSSPDSPFSLMSSFTLSNHLLLGLPIFLVLSLPSPSFLRCAPLFSSHAHTTSASFSGFFCDFPNFRCRPYSLISYLVQFRNSAEFII